MRKGNLSRDEAIAEFGIDAVVSVEKADAHATDRVQCDGDEAVEFAATVNCKNQDGDDCRLVAYYYQSREDVAGCGDLSLLDWEIEGYDSI